MQMKNILFTMAMATFVQIASHAQVTMQPAIPAIGLIQKNQLWSILVVNNTGNVYNAKLDLVLTDRATGQEIMTAGTGQFVVHAGTKQLNADALTPIQYTSLNSSVDSKMQGLIPVGTYTACYSLTAIGLKEGLLSEECVSFDVEPLSPPILMFPADSSSLEPVASQFSWIPPTPVGLFNNLRYEVLITEIKDGQKANEAIEENLPFYNDGNQLSTNMVYPGSAPAFEKEKWYAWEVIARDDKSYAGKSEVWVFKVAEPSVVKMIIEQTPFIKMKKDNPEKGIAPNSILKLSYINETTDSIAEVKIIDLNSQNKTIGQFNIALKPGENLIQYNLKKIVHTEEGKIYEAQITNARKEKWVMQFEVHKYEENKTESK